MNATTTQVPLNALVQALAALGVEVDMGAAAPATTAPATKAPAADAKYRSQKQIDAGHEAERVIYARYRTTTGKSFKAMTAKQQAACKAEVKAVWSGLKGARKTPVAK